jgi:hypothetical protein
VPSCVGRSIGSPGRAHSTLHSCTSGLQSTPSHSHSESAVFWDGHVETTGQALLSAACNAREVLSQITLHKVEDWGHPSDTKAMPDPAEQPFSSSQCNLTGRSLLPGTGRQGQASGRHLLA